MKSAWLVLVLLSSPSFANETSGFGLLLGSQRLQDEVLEDFQKIKQSEGVPGPLADQLETCRGDSDIFDPKKFELSEDTKRKMCDALPPFGKDLVGGDQGQSQCEVTLFSACAIEMNKTFTRTVQATWTQNFEWSVMVGEEWAYRQDRYTQGQAAQPQESAQLIIHCELIAELGVHPSWRCASKYKWLWYIEASHLEINEGSIVMSENGRGTTPRTLYDPVLTSEVWQQFLTSAGVPR